MFSTLHFKLHNIESEGDSECLLAGKNFRNLQIFLVVLLCTD